MERLEVSATSVLRLAPHIVFRFDDTRQRWIMMAPERLMLPAGLMRPDERGVETRQLVDGKTGVGAIIDALATRYTQAPRELIATDVTAMLQDLADKGCLADASAH